MDFEAWLTFVVIWTLAGIPLGPNALNCMSTCVALGFARSLYTIVGILLAACVFMGLVASGLSALLLANAMLFSTVKLFGAGYIIWLGISLWRRPSAPLTLAPLKQVTGLQLVRSSFLISLSNPKAILSYGAVFSQFIDSERALQAQLTVLMPTALAIAALIYLGYCWLGLALQRLLNTARRMTVFDRAVGSAYILAGCAIAYTSLGGEQEPARAT